MAVTDLHMAMKALSSKPFVGQEAKLHSRAAGVSAARLPVVVRAQAEEPVSMQSLERVAQLRTCQVLLGRRPRAAAGSCQRLSGRQQAHACVTGGTG